MGGYGSGRQSDKLKIEECNSLDVNQLNRDGCFKSGWNGVISWTRNGKKFSTIGMRATANYLHLSYCTVLIHIHPSIFSDYKVIFWKLCVLWAFYVNWEYRLARIAWLAWVYVWFAKKCCLACLTPRIGTKFIEKVIFVKYRFKRFIRLSLIIALMGWIFIL